MRTQSWYKTMVSPIVVGYVCFALIAYYAIFYLPYNFPPTQQGLFSDSYVFGFNNSVAIVSIVMLLALATLIRFLYLRWFQYQPDISFPKVGEDTSRIPNYIFWFMALLYLIFTVAIYLWAQAARFYWFDWESSHFLWRLKLMDLYGLRPYVDFHFEYGPALIYLPSYFHQLLSAWSVSHEASYYAFHYLIDLLGLYCIFSLLNRAIMPLRYKKIAFGILALASFAPYMGLNGISARFLVPYLSLVVVHQKILQAVKEALWLRLLRTFILVFLASVINISISADIGLAFSIALVAYAAFFFRRNLWGVIISLSALALAIVLCRMLLPAAYYESVLSFSKGANNFPLLPAAHLLLYIITLFFAVPSLMVAAILHKNASAPLLFALGILSVALIPGAFGRCDPPHVFFYGLGISLITFILMANTTKKRFLLYAAAYICVSIVGLQWSNARWFGVSYQSALVIPKKFALVVASKLGFKEEREKNRLKESRTVEQGRDANALSYLSALDKYPKLGLPFANYGTDKITENYLWKQKKIAPEYYVGAVAVYTEADLSRKLKDVSRHEYMLLLKNFWNPNGSPVTCYWRRKYIELSFIYPVTLPCKRKGLDMNSEISRYISNSYRIVETVGDNIILKRID